MPRRSATAWGRQALACVNPAAASSSHMRKLHSLAPFFMSEAQAVLGDRTWQFTGMAVQPERPESKLPSILQGLLQSAALTQQAVACCKRMS